MVRLGKLDVVPRVGDIWSCRFGNMQDDSGSNTVAFLILAVEEKEVQYDGDKARIEYWMEGTVVMEDIFGLGARAGSSPGGIGSPLKSTEGFAMHAGNARRFKLIQRGN